jgi:hypothetical protein
MKFALISRQISSVEDCDAWSLTRRSRRPAFVDVDANGGSAEDK